jgi:hypothetical protein
MSYKSDFIGVEVIGYRYGEAPRDGNSFRASYNYRDEFFESGISLAGVLRAAPCQSFAVAENAECCKKYYYRGVISGIGSDGEFCIDPVTAKESTCAEYRAFCAANHALSNALNAAQEADALAPYPVDAEKIKLQYGFDLAFAGRRVSGGEDAAIEFYARKNRKSREQKQERFSKYYYKK